MTYEQYIAQAKANGISVDWGINWIWFNGFKSKEACEAFIKEAMNHEFGESRGVYDNPDGTFSTRMR